MLHLLILLHKIKISNFDLGGGERIRTDDLLRARQALSQLSYTPDNTVVVGLDGIEPSTSRLSGVRSDQTELQAPVFRILEAGFRTVYEMIRPNSLSKIQNPIEPIDIKNQRAALDPSKLNSDVRVGFKGLSYRRFFKNHP